MLKRLVLLYLFMVLLCNPGSIDAKASDNEVMLHDSNGRMLAEVSGMAVSEHLLFFIEQRLDILYFLEKETLRAAFHNKSETVRLKSAVLTGALPNRKSWEAVTVVNMGDEHRLFLSHEYDGDGDVHQVYSAGIQLHENNITLGEIGTLGKALPFSNDKKIPMKRRANYGYEALVWLQEDSKLLVVPELAQQDIILIDNKKQQNYQIERHLYRLSDAAQASNQCVVFTSFCHPSDYSCKKNNDDSKLTLVSAKVNNGQLQFVDELDISEKYLALGFDPAISMSSKKTRLFNAEAIVLFGSGFLLANDNNPQGLARSVVRYFPNLSLNSDSCKFQ
ncbi:MAG: hypothetical protein HWE10_10960 [Gammaproteobacteria bacterium]|nr:hypothetical protein [Gammaproteobacteria bacterium]